MTSGPEYHHPTGKAMASLMVGLDPMGLLSPVTLNIIK